jgi:hypothetical protein
MLVPKRVPIKNDISFVKDLEEVTNDIEKSKNINIHVKNNIVRQLRISIEKYKEENRLKGTAKKSP